MKSNGEVASQTKADTHPKPKGVKKRSRKARIGSFYWWFWGSMLLYLLSMVLPVTFQSMNGPGVERIVAIPMTPSPNGAAFILGYEFFLVTMFCLLLPFEGVFLVLVGWPWLANPLFWVGCIFLLRWKSKRSEIMRKLAFRFGVGALVIGAASVLLYHSVVSTDFPLLFGYYAWMLSFVMLVVNAWLPLEQKKSR